MKNYQTHHALGTSHKPIYAALLVLTTLGNLKCASKRFSDSSGVKVTNQQNSEPAQIIFQSGFEGTSRIVPSGSSDKEIIGKDTSLQEKNDWVNDLDKSTDGGDFSFQYTGGDSTLRNVKIIPDPGNPKNKVLRFWLNDYWLASENQQKARVQANLYNIKQGYKEFYQSVRVFIANDFRELRFYPHKLDWLTISEFWNNEWWSKPDNHGFRISLGIGKKTDQPGNLVFTLNAQDVGFKEIWNADDQQVKVPIGKWFTMEYYFKEGDQHTGRFYMTIQPDGSKKQLVFDVHNFTHNTNDPSPDGLTDYNPMKLYTSKDVVTYMKKRHKTLQIYWDDFKLWKNKRPDN